MSVPLAKVPTKFRRMAMRHIETVSTSPSLDTAKRDAELGPNAWPLYRPDIDGIAYWQFELVDDANLADSAPFGFVIVSTDEHDFPVPHWSFERPPVSTILEDEAKKRGRNVARIYRLDALAYLAEDDTGAEAARSGEVPALVEPSVADATESSSVTVRPKAKGDDTKADQAQFVVERKGPQGDGLKLADPSDWGTLKSRYGVAFGRQLADVRRGAGHSWKIDRDVEEFGEGLMAGEPFSIRLLRMEAKVEVRGDGKDEITFERDDKRRGPARLQGRARLRSHEREVGLEVHVTYDNGESEVLRYFVVSPDTRSKARPTSEGGSR